ncbi:predicted protein [Sclerotinia sclerotiorum 1980 UF-70]|uniref:Uncharacterized protein n=1 Tax=Sclerotinia sclerotiorum (strain ATCC 18683 / 1980 / Ss-1) TaxID=665079 RepID=A7EKP2_SCLS1|nr:predicted protein [Sclerotinia sclerotiorum 1980 UF-70]EDO03408.1 predicted protein [Sclerotinia sclerotiorum 1980 UF-70]
MSKSFESGRGEIFSDVDVVVIALSMKVWYLVLAGSGKAILICEEPLNTRSGDGTSR